MSPQFESETLSSNEMQTVQKTEEKGRRGGMQAPFGVRDFRLLFGGQTISTTGDAFYAVALPWLVLTSGGSAQELGIILTAYGIPRVGSVLLGGALSDRLRPRRVMLLADAVRAILVGILAVLALWGNPNVWQFCLVAVPLGAFQGLFLPASFAILPEVLHNEELQAGNSLNFSSTQLAMLLGSALAGIVVASFHSGIALAFDAFTFVVSAVSLALMRAGRRSVSDITGKLDRQRGRANVRRPDRRADEAASDEPGSLTANARPYRGNGPGRAFADRSRKWERANVRRPDRRADEAASDEPGSQTANACPYRGEQELREWPAGSVADEMDDVASEAAADAVEKTEGEEAESEKSKEQELTLWKCSGGGALYGHRGY